MKKQPTTSDLKPDIKVSKNGVFWHWQITFGDGRPICEGLVKDEREAWRIAREAYIKCGFKEKI